MEKKCKTCGVIIGGRALYCETCRQKARAASMEKWLAKRDETRLCECCGKPLPPLAKRFCSNECRIAGVKGKPRQAANTEAIATSPIAIARRAKGLSRAKLAERLGVSSGMVYAWETGSSRPTMKSLMPLAKALEVPVSTLMPQE